MEITPDYLDLGHRVQHGTLKRTEEMLGLRMGTSSDVCIKW